MRALRGIALLGALLPILFGPAEVAAQPPAIPTASELRVETGTHGGRINRLLPDPFDERIITIGDDKTGRIWFRDGSLSTTFRVPMAPGDEGRLHAIAVSPSGNSIVVGGYTGLSWFGRADLYLFERATGNWRGRMSLGESARAVIRDMAFLPDSRLAVALDDAKGLRLVDFAAQQVSIADAEYSAPIVALAVAADGRLASASQDGGVRLYDPQLKRIARYQVPAASGQPFRLAFSGDGSRLAVGLTGGPSPQVLLLTGDTLQPKQTFAGAEGRRGTLSSVSFSGDGKSLYAAGSYSDGEGLRLIRRWPLDGGPAVDLSLGKRDIVTDLQPLKDGGVAFATADPMWGIIAANGQTTLAQAPRQADFRDGYDGCFAVSADGSVVDFGLASRGRDCVRFNVATSSLERDRPARADLGRPAASAGGTTVTEWRNEARPKINGQPVVLGERELARSVAVAADGSVAMGTDFSLRLYRGTNLVWKTDLASPVWMVAMTADRRFVVAGLGDGSIRWFKAANGEPVIQLLVLPGKDTWVLWTPEGYFDHGTGTRAGQGGEDLIGYQRNRLRDGQLDGTDFVDVGQMYQRFFARNLVKQKFRGEGEEKIKTDLKKYGDVDKLLDEGLPPALRIVEICADVGGEVKCQSFDDTRATRAARPTAPPVDEPQLILKLEAADRGGGFGEIEVYRNDVPITAARQVTRGAAPAGSKRIETLTVPLRSGDNIIAVAARNAQGTIETAPPERPQLSVTSKVPPPVEKPTLRLLSVGVNRFADKVFDQNNALTFAVADARGIVELLAPDRGGGLYGAVDAVLLTDEQATRANIKRAMDEMAARTNENDVGLIFLAGHGALYDRRYFFIPYDIRGRQEADWYASSITDKDIAAFVKKLPSRLFVAMDTCFSGGLVGDDVSTIGDLLKQATARLFLFGATDKQTALDGIKDHGVFTGVLLDGLSGRADGDHDGEVDAMEAVLFTQKKVPEAAKQVGHGHRQTPQFFGTYTETYALRRVAP